MKNIRTKNKIDLAGRYNCIISYSSSEIIGLEVIDSKSSESTTIDLKNLKINIPGLDMSNISAFLDADNGFYLHFNPWNKSIALNGGLKAGMYGGGYPTGASHCDWDKWPDSTEGYGDTQEASTYTSTDDSSSSTQVNTSSSTTAQSSSSNSSQGIASKVVKKVKEVANEAERIVDETLETVSTCSIS